MKIAITGASGMLGTSLVSLLSKKYKIYANSHSKSLNHSNVEWECFDITSQHLLISWLEKVRPEVVIYCAAMVNLDLCEKEKDLAKSIHFGSAKIALDFQKNTKNRFIYISTDGVFDGTKNLSYKETDIPNPINVYAKTKYLAEQEIIKYTHSLILRTNIVGFNKNKTSFMDWVVRSLQENKELNLFTDARFSPIHVDSLSDVIKQIIEKPIYGLYHCASCESISKFDFVKEFIREMNYKTFTANPISIEEFKFIAKRPKNLALDVSKLENKLNLKLPTISDCIMSLTNSFN